METIPGYVLDFLREQFPEGTRVQLREDMESDAGVMKAGDIGTLEHIDDAGTFHIRMNDGAEVGLTMDRDGFDMLPPEITGLKLYMPMTAEIIDEDVDERYEDPEIPLDSYNLVGYRDEIEAALEREKMPEEAERGIMRWYSDPDGVNRKVLSAEFRAEVRDDRLWCVTDCKVLGRLTPKELDALKGFISGQASDGWGENFEQREIETPQGDMYVHMWQYGGDWSIQTEEERFPADRKKAEPDKKRGKAR